MKALLATRPEHDDTTYYLSYWCKKIIELARKKGLDVFDLRKEKISKKKVENILSKKNPKYVIFNGHGSAVAIAGNSRKDIIIKAGENDKLLKDKVIHAISCKAGLRLGPSSIKNGAKSFIGYKEDFIFFYDPNLVTHPEKDKTVKLFLDPLNEVSESLIKGKTVKEAHLKSQKKYKENIFKLLTSKSPEDKTYLRYLWWDMKNHVCLGEPTETIN